MQGSGRTGFGRWLRGGMIAGAGLALTGASLMASPARAEESSDVADVRVAFDVVNTNRSAVPCSSDGERYTIRGHLVGPRAVLRSSGAKLVTLYLHGFDAGEWFWSFDLVAGYDYAQAMAKAGHVSVVVDRLGYVSSDRPGGAATCLGAQADAANQIVGQLRGGSYSSDGVTPIAFSRVVLAGHSIGGSIAEITAYSFANVDALAVLGYADGGTSQGTQISLARALTVCAAGGQPASDGGPSGYAYFVQTDEESKAALFHDAEPAVADAATRIRTRNPCGDLASTVTALALNRARIVEIDVPVLLVYGDRDEVFPPEAGGQHKDRFTGTNDVTLVSLKDTGHFFTLERTAGALVVSTSAWLDAHSFGIRGSRVLGTRARHEALAATGAPVTRLVMFAALSLALGLVVRATSTRLRRVRSR